MEDYIMVSFRKNVLTRVLALGVVFVEIYSFVGAMKKKKENENQELLTISKIKTRIDQIKDEQFILVTQLQEDFNQKQTQITWELQETKSVLNKTYIYLFNLGKWCEIRLPKNITFEQQIKNIYNNKSYPVIVAQLFELLVQYFRVEQKSAKKKLSDQQKEIKTPEQLNNLLISLTNAITRITKIKSMFEKMEQFVDCLNKQPRIRNLKKQQKNSYNYQNFLINMQNLSKVTRVPEIIQQLQNSLNILNDIQISIQNDMQKIMAGQGASKCKFWIGWKRVGNPFLYEYVQQVLTFVYDQCLNCPERMDEIKEIEKLQKEKVKELRTEIFKVFNENEINEKAYMSDDNNNDKPQKKTTTSNSNNEQALFNKLKEIEKQDPNNTNFVVLRQQLTKIEMSIKEQEQLNKVKKQHEKQKIGTQLLKLKEEYEYQQEKKPQNLKLQQNNNLNSQSSKFKSALLNFAKIGITPALAILYAYYVINIKSFE
jgi:hypothetical protein